MERQSIQIHLFYYVQIHTIFFNLFIFEATIMVAKTGLPQSWKVLESPGIRKRSWKVLESPGISLIFAESPGKVLEFYTAPSMSFSNSRTFQDCGKCYIIFYIAVVYFSILICHFVLVTPCYITCWKNSVFLFFAYSGVSKSPGKSWNF